MQWWRRTCTRRSRLLTEVNTVGKHGPVQGYLAHTKTPTPSTVVATDLYQALEARVASIDSMFLVASLFTYTGTAPYPPPLQSEQEGERSA